MKWKFERKHEFFHICILFLFLSSFISVLPVRIEATSNITEDSNYYTIENDYFIAKIPKNQSGHAQTAGVGTIRELYIKPQTTINIVSHTSGFNTIFGTEFACVNGSNTWAADCWGGSTMWGAAVEKIYESSSIIVIKSSFTFKTEIDARRANFTATHYITFYDQPYYVVTITRHYEDSHAHQFNSELCMLYDTDDFWDKDDAGTWYASNRTGHAVADYIGGSYLHEADIYGKFPWYYVINTTMGVGHGTILVDAYPRRILRMGDIAGGTAHRYSEFQIHDFFALRGDTNQTMTIVQYCGDTTSYSGIEALATQLYNSRKTAVGSDEAEFPMALNRKHPTTSYNRFGSSWQFLVQRPLGAYWGFQGWDSSGMSYQEAYFKYKNATSTYGIIPTWTYVNVIDVSYNKTYGTVTWNATYESKLNWKLKWEEWDDSDTIRLTMTLETLTSVNITEAYFYWFTGSVNALSTDLGGSYCKMNASGASGYICSTIKEEAYLVKNLTNTERTLPYAKMQQYWVKNGADVEYSSGQTWTMQLDIQYFKTYANWCDTWVSGANYTAPEEHSSYMETINYQSWVVLPLFNPQSNLTINCVGSPNSQLADSSLSNDILTLLLVGDTGNTTTRHIYCGSKGEPTTVNGASSWSYNATSKILTIRAIYNSSNTITVECIWSPKLPNPLEALKELIQTVESWNLAAGIENSLTSKLQAAYRLLDMGEQKKSIAQLTAFIRKVETLREKKLTSEQADYLTAEAQRIIGVIKG